MESYLMMLYVTLDQESALKSFFVDQGWAFCKPDLSVTTDRLGSSTGPLHANRSCTRTSPRLVGKRKAETDQHRAPVVKTAKILHTVPSMSSNIAETDCVQTEQLDVTKETELFGICSSVDGGSSVSEDQGETLIKVETFDVSYNPDECDEEYDDDTDIDYEEAKTDDEEEPLTVTEDKSLNTLQGDIATDVPKATKNVKGGKYGVRHHHSYSQSQIDAALNHYIETQATGKKMSMRRLAKMFSVPMTTLFNHIRSASGNMQKNIVCEVCGRVFTYQHQLKQHVRHHHGGLQTMYSCHFCPKSFHFKARLQHHLNMHNDERPYICKNMCGKSYFSPQSRYSHEQLCQSNYPRPFQCTKCGLSFKVQSAMTRHFSAKHGAPRYTCGCGQAFGWSQSCNRHKKTCKKNQKDVLDENELNIVIKTINENRTIQESIPLPGTDHILLPKGAPFQEIEHIS